jgi:hypothetical protein
MVVRASKGVFGQTCMLLLIAGLLCYPMQCMAVFGRIGVRKVTGQHHADFLLPLIFEGINVNDRTFHHEDQTGRDVFLKLFRSDVHGSTDFIRIVGDEHTVLRQSSVLRFSSAEGYSYQQENYGGASWVNDFKPNVQLILIDMGVFDRECLPSNCEY